MENAHALLDKLVKWRLSPPGSQHVLRELKEEVVILCGLEPAQIDDLPDSHTDPGGLILALEDYLKDYLGL